MAKKIEEIKEFLKPMFRLKFKKAQELARKNNILGIYSSLLIIYILFLFIALNINLLYVLPWFISLDFSYQLLFVFFGVFIVIIYSGLKKLGKSSKPRKIKVFSPKLHRTINIESTESKTERIEKGNFGRNYLLMLYALVYLLSALNAILIIFGEAYFYISVFLGTNILAFYLNNKYPNKLEWFISLFAATYMPFHFQDNIPEIIYLIYFTLITILWLHFAQKNSWKYFNFIVLLNSTIILYLFVIQSESSITSFSIDKRYLILFHLFAYIFSFSVFLGKRQSEEELNQTTFVKKIFQDIKGVRINSTLNLPNILLLLTAVFLLMSGIFYYFRKEETTYLLGLTYMVNTLPFIATVSVFRKRFDKQINTTLIIIINCLIAAATLSFFTEKITAMIFIFTFVAFTELQFGYHTNTLNIRLNGYLFLSVVIILISLFFRFINFDLKQPLLTKGFYYLLFFGFLLSYLTAVFSKYKQVANKTNIEKYLPKFILEILSVWFIFVFLLVFWHLLPEYLAIIALFPSLLFLFYGTQHNLLFTKFLAYSIYILISAYSAFFSYQYFLTENLADFFLNYLILGSLLLILKFWYIISNGVKIQNQHIVVKHINFAPYSNDNYRKNRFIQILNFIFMVWCLSFYYLYYYIHQPPILYVVYGIYIPSILFLHHGFSQNFFWTKIIGHIFLFIPLLYSLLNILNQSNIYLTLALPGVNVAICGTILWGIYKTPVSVGLIEIKANSDEIKNYKFQILNIPTYFQSFAAILKSIKIGILHIDNTISKTKQTILNIFVYVFATWFVLFFLLNTYRLLGNFIYSTSIIPMFILLFWGIKKDKPLLEYLGLALSLVLFTGIFHSLVESGYSLRISKQPLFGKIVIIETYLLLLCLDLFYQKILKGGTFLKHSPKLKEIFFILMPIAILQQGFSKLKPYFPYILWIVMLITIIIAEITKYKSIFKEYWLWFITAILLTFYKQYIPLEIYGIIFLALPMIYAKIRKGKVQNSYKHHLPIISILSLNIVISGYLIIMQTSIYQIIGFFSLLTLIPLFLESKIQIFQKLFIRKILYRTTILLLIYNSYLVLQNLPDFTNKVFLQNFIFSIIILVGIIFITYNKLASYPGNNLGIFHQLDILLLQGFYLSWILYVLKILNIENITYSRIFHIILIFYASLCLIAGLRNKNKLLVLFSSILFAFVVFITLLLAFYNFNKLD